MGTRSQSSSKKAGRNEKESIVLTEDESVSTIAEVMDILKTINTNIKQIMSNQQDFEARFKSLEEKVTQQSNTIKDLEKSITYYVNEATELQSVSKEMKITLSNMNREIADHEAKIASVQNDLVNQERYSRGFNLRFTGIPENHAGETRREDCCEKIKKLVLDHAGLSVDIENAHRVGRPSTEKPRHILVKFLRRPDRFAVLKARSKLRDTGVNVLDDMPRKDFLMWISLQGVIKEAKEAGKRTIFKKGELYIDGKLYSAT